MNLKRHTGLLAALLMSVAVSCVLAGCSSDKEDFPDAGMAVLSIRVSLHGGYEGLDSHMPRVRASIYEPDKFASHDMEKMHSLRVVILDSDGAVEHNTLWDLTAAPAEYVSGGDFPVKAGDMKTILLIANEERQTLQLHDGTKVSASDFFRGLSASVGSVVDVDNLRQIVIPVIEDATDHRTGILTYPMAMSAIYGYYIGTDSDRYSAVFNIHRTMVKYTFRITNKDIARPHTVDEIGIDRIASFGWLFPNAVYQDEAQTLLSGYVAADSSTGKKITYSIADELKPGETREYGPYYFPEGAPVVGGGDAYSVLFGFDGVSTGWRGLEWSVPEVPDESFPMMDLPRNTHVVVNASFDFVGLKLNYTVCPWVVSDIDIPSFD